MVRTCMAFGCRGNYKGEPYTKMVSSWDEESRLRWISAMPNASAQLRDKEKIWLCITHFEGEWKATQGGSKPVNLPTVFSGIPKSCLKQTNNKPRQSERSSSSARRKHSEE